jgi:virulence factor Mce-like protein
MRKATATLAASPVMIGAVTVLVAVVAVFLAYNANQGLPFVPSYRLSAQVPNANQLIPGNEVRMGGVRVGVVETVEPQQTEDGDVSVLMNMALDPQVDPLPVDSKVLVRSRSALGLKYLEITRGSSNEGYRAGDVMPLSAAEVKPVEIDEVLGTFDEPTRDAMQQNLVEFGNAVAGRGPQLNAALGDLPPLLRVLQPVMRNLSDPRTRLGRFFEALAATAAEVAPVAAEQGRMFVSLDTTFTALASVARPFIQETISETPPTLDLATETLPRLRPFLSHSAALFADLEPGIEALRANAPAIADSLEVGAVALEDAPRFNRDLVPATQALEDRTNDPAFRAGIDRLTETGQISTPLFEFIAPAQTVCNYASIFARNVATSFSQGSGGGTWQRFQAIFAPDGPNNESGPSDAPANGGPGSELGNFLHSNPYPNTAAPGQERECEAGNEGYLAGQQVIGNVPGNQGTTTDVIE